MSKRALAATLLAWVVVLSAAADAGCSGGGDDEPSTEPTVDAAAEVTQAAISTSEAIGAGTPTRVPSPSTQPTLASGTIRLAASSDAAASGLLEVLLPMFEAETGYGVVVAPSSSGAAIAAAQRGEADLLLVQSTYAERVFLAEGGGTGPIPVMKSSYIIVGPETDTADAHAQDTAHDVFQKIADLAAPYVSRGDASDTDLLEQEIWLSAEITPSGQPWYTTTGLDMAATLRAASESAAYVLSDRGSYLEAKDALALVIQFDGDVKLDRTYDAIPVSAQLGSLNVTGAEALAAFLTRADVQQIIAEYGAAEYGEPFFSPGPCCN